MSQVASSITDLPLSQLFFDVTRDPSLAVELRSNPERVFARYQLEQTVRRAVERNDVKFLAERVNPYLLRYFFSAMGMQDQEFIEALGPKHGVLGAFRG